MKDWGAVIRRFGLRNEIEEAVKCYALARYTAAIFHLMRITESAAIELGKLVEPGDPKPQFSSVLKKIEQLLRKTKWQDWPNEIKPHKQLFTVVLPRLYALMDSWRENASHFDTHIVPTDTVWTKADAHQIYHSTLSLMQLLGNRLPPKSASS